MQILNPEIRKQMKTFLSLISSIAWIQDQMGDTWTQARNVIEVEGGTNLCLFNLDVSQLVGMPCTEVIKVPINTRVWILNKDPRKAICNDYLMYYGYEPKTATLFYWTTEMITIYPLGVSNHDPSKTGQFSGFGLFNAPGRRGNRTASSCN